MAQLGQRPSVALMASSIPLERTEGMQGRQEEVKVLPPASNVEPNVPHQNHHQGGEKSLQRLPGTLGRLIAQHALFRRKESGHTTSALQQQKQNDLLHRKWLRKTRMPASRPPQDVSGSSAQTLPGSPRALVSTPRYEHGWARYENKTKTANPRRRTAPAQRGHTSGIVPLQWHR